MSTRSILATALAATTLTVSSFQAQGNAAAFTFLHHLRAGQAIIDYDVAAFGTLASGIAPPPVLSLDEVFDQAEANAVDYSGLFTTDNDPSPSGLGLLYGLNRPTVTNLPGRTTQPTTFTFEVGRPTGLPGVRRPLGDIGLGGVTRWAVSPSAGGGFLLFGDLTLEWDPARQALGGTGWHLVGHIPPVATIFDLTNVVITHNFPYLHVSGDLAISWEMAYLLFNTPADHLVDVGDFEFLGVYR